MQVARAYRHPGIPQMVDVWAEEAWWPAQVLASRERAVVAEVFVRIFRRPDHYYYRWITTSRVRDVGGDGGDAPRPPSACSLVSAVGAPGTTLN